MADRTVKDLIEFLKTCDPTDTVIPYEGHGLAIFIKRKGFNFDGIWNQDSSEAGDDNLPYKTSIGLEDV